MSACLVVRDESVPYIRRLLGGMQRALSEHAGGEVPVVVCSEVDEAETGGAETLYLIGERFGRFRRQPGRRYVYFNFSVVAALGSPLALSRPGRTQLRYKRRLLKDKLDLLDAVLDYYPAQTRWLARRLRKPVFGFLPFVPPADGAGRAFAERKYDVCFVGTQTPRRRRLLEDLARRGLRLSPLEGADLEELAAESRLTLNVHMQQSNHLEIPRIIGAMSAGSPVLTEESHGIGDVVPPDLVAVAPYRHLSGAVVAALADRAALEDRAARSSAWYSDVYLPRCRALLARSLAAIDGLSR